MCINSGSRHGKHGTLISKLACAKPLQRRQGIYVSGPGVGPLLDLAMHLSMLVVVFLLMLGFDLVLFFLFFFSSPLLLYNRIVLISLEKYLECSR